MTSLHPIIALLTDFGLQDTYVGVMKGVIAGIAPQAKVIDLTHAIPPQDVQTAAFALLTSYQDFPSGTVFCCVVDPEVGGERAALALGLETSQGAVYTFVFPDNGLLTPILQEASVTRVVQLDKPEFHHKASRTFHGRDIFAPASAYLAAGAALESLGSSFDPSRLRQLEWPQPRAQRDGFEAQVIHIDHFGNLVTNLRGERLEPDLKAWRVECKGVALEGIAVTFAEVERGEGVGYVGSSGYLELAVRQGSAAKAWDAQRGDAIMVTRSTRC